MTPQTSPKTIATGLGTSRPTRLFLLVLLLAAPAVIHAQYLYTTNNGTITITGYTGPGGAVVIPSTINGLPVNTIGDNAFMYCASLASVTIPDSVASIGGAAFAWCANLVAVTIPEGVTNIGTGAFVDCTSLANVALPSSVISIGDFAFSRCFGLSTITVNALNYFYSSVDGVLFDKGRTKLIAYPGGRAGAYTIPDSVTNIGNAAFYYCSSVSDLAIGTNVTTIGRSAFYYCSSLTNVAIPDSVNRIGDNAFYHCASLVSITIPASVISIGAQAFAYCTGLAGVYFKGNAPSLEGYFVFEGADNATVYYLLGTTGWGPTYGGRPTAIWSLPSAPCTIPPPGLVAWWPGEGNADDIAGTNNGVLEGGVAFADGEVGTAFSFNGASSLVTNAMPVLTNIRNSYTMEFWAWPNAARASTPEATWFGYAGHYQQRFAIVPCGTGVAGLAGVGVSVGANGVSVIENGSSVLVYDAPIVGWTHIAVLYQNQRPALYVNGVLVRIGLVSGIDSCPSTWLGSQYVGLLDEVSIYSRALSAAEIQAIYSAGAAGKCRVPAMAAPTITLQPERCRAVLAGWTNTFRVEAFGTAPLNYQWQRAGTNVPGATAASLTLTNIQLADAGTYSVLVSNDYGSTNSEPAILAVVFPNSSPVKYVNVSNATPVAPFSTWATAAIHIQDAILFANDADTVLVRRGVYNESIDFMGKAIVVTSEESPDATIIDANRARSVVTFSGGEGTSTMIQGFTIINGYAAQGGGICCTNASPVISHCVIAGNSTFVGTNGQGSPYPPYGTAGGNGGDGAGLYGSDNSWPTIIDCVISNNATGTGGRADYASWCGNGGNGGGIACSSATIVRTLITANATAGGGMDMQGRGGNGGNGGGIFCGSALVLDSVVQNNTTGPGSWTWGGSTRARGGNGGKGGGICCFADAEVEGCTILSNRTGVGAGCEYTSGDGGDGGGIYGAGGLPRFRSCAFLGNSTGNGGAQDHYGGRGGNGAGFCTASNCSPVVSSCSFVENRTGSGGWASCRWSVHSIGGAGGKGGGVFCFGGTFSDCTFQANTTGNGGVGRSYDPNHGASYLADGGTGGDGGGMYANGPVIVRSCLLGGNTTGLGGDGSYGIGGNGGSGAGIWNQGGTVANCTTWGNSLGIGGAIVPSTNRPGINGAGGGIWSSNGLVLNCILWNDAGSELAGSGFQVSYSDIQGGNGQPWFDPANCIDADPRFVNPVPGDWHLAGTSPCINAGMNQSWMSDAIDLEGNPRILFGIVDMGAFESQYGVTPIQAVERLLAQVEASWPRSQPLIASLSAALYSIERGNTVSAIRQLLVFQSKVRAQVAPSDPALAASFIAAAQRVIDALRGDAKIRGGPPHGRFTAVARQANGRVQMQWSALPGRLYVLEASTNLVNWERIGVAVDQGQGRFAFEDANAARFPNRFYRVVAP